MSNLSKRQMLKQLEDEKKHEQEALEIGNKIKEKMWKKYKKEGW